MQGPLGLCNRHSVRPRRSPAALRTLRVYDGFYHELFNEPGEGGARAIADLAAWIVAVAGAPPATVEA